MSWWKTWESRREVAELKGVIAALHTAVNERDELNGKLRVISENRMDEILRLEEKIDSLAASNKELTDKLVECQRKLGRVNTDCQMARNAILSAIASTEAEGCRKQSGNETEFKDAILTTEERIAEIASFELNFLPPCPAD